jgi:asparagine synthase (glutamine-hydrolysing)
MAGIAGIAIHNEQERVDRALGVIAHRGGVGRRASSYDGATLGCVWPLAHSSFAGAAPPDPVVLDGEVHNWADLACGAASPLAALRCAYDRLGPALAAELDGPFAIALAAPGGVFLARDRVGKSPLYWGVFKGALCFASEIKGLLGWAQDISEFPPGHCYDADHGLIQYASIETRKPFESNAERIAAGLRDLLHRSVRKRLHDGPVGAWLSGGLDSATMVALARCDLPTLHTFSVGLEDATDLQCARAVAEAVGTQHHERVCTVDELMALLPTVIYHLESFDALLVRSSVMNFLVGREASGFVPAVLSGEGGDELFAGYDYLTALPPEALGEELVDITRRLHNTALQRVDRCSAAHGLVARTGFLDREVLQYALCIPPELKTKTNGAAVGKWILRVAMDGLLPEAILWRPKAKFWEGAGLGELLAAHVEQIISDAEFERQRTLPGGTRLNTKEELYYYRIFREQFGPELDVSLVGRTKGAPVAH